jgi:hypothetical protein
MPDWLKAALGSISAAFLAVMTAVIKHLWTKQKCQSARQDAVEDGVKALLHDRIYGIYSDCHQKNYASVDDIRNLEYLYQPYHALGGNGTGTELYERVKKMPVEPAREDN